MKSPRGLDETIACRVTIRGVVQGVGFRPFVFRTAVQNCVSGWVLNGAAGVEIHAEGRQSQLDAFLRELQSAPPPAARIAHLDVVDAELCGLSTFEIADSRSESSPTVRVSPDLAICDDCLRELNDPSDRRFLYPYINCTNCGPRYSIINQLPYDRRHTTMAQWPLCVSCQREYDDPLNRRHHAQPTACAKCGPSYELVVGGVHLGRGEMAIRECARRLAAGEIVAVKGIGGYHLACDARNVAAVSKLRTRKYRKEKPFALMVRTIDEARSLIDLTAAHEQLLLDSARPIVLVKSKVELPGVAPESTMLGVMLPYAPLHHMFFDLGTPSPLVLTSANRSSEPIAYRDDDAHERLAGIADAFLIGERPIARRVDDSVATIRAGRPVLIRRARGYAPGSVCTLPSSEPILALGSDLKNAVALVVRGEVFVSQHIGDLGDYEANRAFEETVRDLLAMYEIDPQGLTVVHDRHPEFVSTRFARELPAAHRIEVQHHQAHVASVLAEHGLFEERVVGVAFDGTGYGDKGAIWGGEIFVGSLREGFGRCANLREVAMPGGDAAAQFPVQAAAGLLAELSDLPDLAAPPFSFPARFTSAMALIAKDARCFRCSSVGRLFDAVAALLGFTRQTTFEGQAAIWLEQQAARVSTQSAYPFPNLDTRPLLQAILRDRLAGRPISEIASAFHAALAAETARQTLHLSKQHQLKTLVLSGGVFQNDLLFDQLTAELNRISDIRILSNINVPVNDGGICLGQAAMAALTQ